MNIPTIRIFLGDEKNMQHIPFTGALNSIGAVIDRSKCSTMTFSQLKDKVRYEGWTQNSLINWLRDADIYVILCHIHQGFGHVPILWNPVEFYAKLYHTLKDRRGFPSGEQLRCPVFTQDKVRYLSALDGLVNPTRIVPILRDFNYAELREELEK
jgi:hypothetical protein